MILNLKLMNVCHSFCNTYNVYLIIQDSFSILIPSLYVQQGKFNKLIQLIFLSIIFIRF